MDSDLTIQVLREIRDGIEQTRSDLRAEIQQTREELGAEIRATNARVERVERRQTEGEIRLATELIAVADAVREVRDELREDRRLRARVDDHERRIDALEKARGETSH